MATKKKKTVEPDPVNPPIDPTTAAKRQSAALPGATVGEARRWDGSTSHRRAEALVGRKVDYPVRATYSLGSKVHDTHLGRLTVIMGDNGKGKTLLCNAISLAAFGTAYDLGFRDDARDPKLLKFLRNVGDGSAPTETTLRTAQAREASWSLDGPKGKAGGTLGAVDLYSLVEAETQKGTDSAMAWLMAHFVTDKDFAAASLPIADDMKEAILGRLGGDTSRLSWLRAQDELGEEIKELKAKMKELKIAASYKAQVASKIAEVTAALTDAEALSAVVDEKFAHVLRTRQDAINARMSGRKDVFPGFGFDDRGQIFFGVITPTGLHARLNGAARMAWIAEVAGSLARLDTSINVPMLLFPDRWLSEATFVALAEHARDVFCGAIYLQACQLTPTCRDALRRLGYTIVDLNGGFDE